MKVNKRGVMANTGNIPINFDSKILQSMVNEAAVIVITSVQEEINRQMKLAQGEIEYETLNNLNIWLQSKASSL